MNDLKIKRQRRRIYEPLSEEKPLQPKPLEPPETSLAAEPTPQAESQTSGEVSKIVEEPEILIGNLSLHRPESEQAAQARRERRDRIRRVEEIVRHHALWSAPFALVPWPFVDALALTVWQLRMLRLITEHYGFGFEPEKGKLWILTLFSSLPPFLMGLAAGKLVGLVSPFAGAITKVGVGALSSSAATYALGRVFVEYFETGGAFLSFDPETAAAGFQAEYQKARASGL